MAKSGLLFVASRIKNNELSEEAYNDWYNNIHLEDILASGGTKLALRFRNVNSEAKMPYLALYPLPDMSFMQSKEARDVPMQHHTFPGSGNVYDSVEFMRRTYELIQTFEGQETKPGMHW